MIEDLVLYLCGPIMGCTDKEANEWRDKVLSVYPRSLNPMVRDYRGITDECVNEIVNLDKRDIRNCDFVVVNYVKPSVGTSMEILYAWEREIPVIVWCDKDAEISPWMKYHATSFVHSFEELVEKIEFIR